MDTPRRRRLFIHTHRLAWRRTRLAVHSRGQARSTCCGRCFLLETAYQFHPLRKRCLVRGKTSRSHVTELSRKKLSQETATPREGHVYMGTPFRTSTSLDNAENGRHVSELPRVFIQKAEAAREGHVHHSFPF